MTAHSVPANEETDFESARMALIEQQIAAAPVDLHLSLRLMQSRLDQRFASQEAPSADAIVARCLSGLEFGPVR